MCAFYNYIFMICFYTLCFRVSLAECHVKSSKLYLYVYFMSCKIQRAANLNEEYAFILSHYIC